MRTRAVQIPISRVWRALYFIAVTAALYAIFHSWTYDDPYITFRYAENLAAGLGFVYNPGEQVLSTSTPLFAMLLAIFAALGLAVPQVANLIGAAALAGGGLLMWEIAQHLGESPAVRRTAGWLGLLLYPAFPLLVTTISSEMPLFLLLCLAAVAVYLKKEVGLAGLLAGLAVLTRGDALLLTGLLFLDMLLRQKMRTWRRLGNFSAAFALPVIPWILFSQSYFGSPLPVSLSVKQSQLFLPEAAGFLTRLGEIAGSHADKPLYWLLLLLALFGMYRLIRARSSGLVLVAWMFGHAIAYEWMQVASSFWYYAPLVPGLLTAAGLGLATLITHPWSEMPDRQPRAVRGTLPLAALLPLLLIFSQQLVDVSEIARRPDNRAWIYRAVGEWFAQNTPEDASIGLLEVGIIGYYANPRPMIDYAGLIRPEVAEQFAEEYSMVDSAVWVAERYQPSYLVVTFGRYSELLEQYTVFRCERAKKFTGFDYGYTFDIWVYLC